MFENFLVAYVYKQFVWSYFRWKWCTKSKHAKLFSIKMINILGSTTSRCLGRYPWCHTGYTGMHSTRKCIRSGRLFVLKCIYTGRKSFALFSNTSLIRKCILNSFQKKISQICRLWFIYMVAVIIQIQLLRCITVGSNYSQKILFWWL